MLYVPKIYVFLATKVKLTFNDHKNTVCKLHGSLGNLRCPGKQFFSHVGTEPPLPGYYQYFRGVRARTPDTMMVNIEK